VAEPPNTPIVLTELLRVEIEARQSRHLKKRGFTLIEPQGWFGIIAILIGVAAAGRLIAHGRHPRGGEKAISSRAIKQSAPPASPSASGPNPEEMRMAAWALKVNIWTVAKLARAADNWFVEIILKWLAPGAGLAHVARPNSTRKPEPPKTIDGSRSPVGRFPAQRVGCLGLFSSGR